MRRLLATSLLPALLLGCGSGSFDTVTVDGVHDLYALFWKAEVTSGDVTETQPLRLFRLVYLDNKVDDRDGIAYIHAPPRTSVTWRDLGTRGTAHLTFGCGVAPMTDPPTPVPVTFRVEVRDALAGGGETGFTTIFEETLAPDDLEAPQHVQRHRVALPERESASWTVRLVTEVAEGRAILPEWPGWFEPVLRSDGRQLPRADHPVRVLTLHEDLLASLEQAEILEQHPDDPVATSAFDTAPDVQVLGGRRTLVSATAPAHIRWTLDVPEDALLDFAVGMDTERGWKLPGDGMTFAVALDGARVWERHLDGHGTLDDRGWHLAGIDLTPWAGRRVTLDLVTETGADPSNDVGGWANLRIQQRTRVPRLARGDAPNVLVILIDTLRADRFGGYGNDNALAPRLDELATQGILFRNARTVASYTWPSTASLFTGLYPHSHGVLGIGQAFLVDRVETLAELFSRGGFTTGAFVANPLIGRAGNFHQGFETFVNAPAVRARALNERVLLWLEEHDGSALFTYIHYFDPHNPYNAPPGYALDESYEQPDVASLPHLETTYADVEWDAQQVRNFNIQNASNLRDYDSEVLYTDDAVGELLDTWERRGLLENTVVVVMSDHGEEFFEHGRPFHGPNLYGESLRIPLFIAGFGDMELEPAVVDRPVQVMDILPTLCDLTGIAGAASALHGTSLLSSGTGEPQFFLSMNAEEVGVDGKTEKLSVLAPPWKLIHTPATDRIELYRIDVDPGELHDLADSEPTVRDRLMDTLESWLTAALRDGAAGEGVSPEQLYWLQELGYLER